jgi:hypothetical protein
MLQTEYEFTLPKGYVDEQGTLHRLGAMRLSTAADEILPLEDVRVEKNPAYLLLILLSRVVTRLGTVRQMTPKVVEGLFSEDLLYLQTFYNHLNGGARLRTQCPSCQHRFEVEPLALGEP